MLQTCCTTAQRNGRCFPFPRITQELDLVVNKGSQCQHFQTAWTRNSTIYKFHKVERGCQELVWADSGLGLRIQAPFQCPLVLVSLHMVDLWCLQQGEKQIPDIIRYKVRHVCRASCLSAFCAYVRCVLTPINSQNVFSAGGTTQLTSVKGSIKAFSSGSNPELINIYTLYLLPSSEIV